MCSLTIYKLTEKDSSHIKFIKDEMAANEWHPGMHDVECFLACDHPGIYIAELNGEPVGFVSFNKYCSSFYTFGIYLVKEKHRGKGYGLQMFKVAMKDVDWSKIVSAYSVPNMVKVYEQYGFESRWWCDWYNLRRSTVLEILKSVPMSHGLTAKSIDVVDKEALLRYDTNVFGYQRHNFILKWLNTEGSHAKVVVNDEGVIVGYAAARVQYVIEEGYCLGPLFADSSEAAQLLLKALFEDISSHGVSSSESIVIACPTGRNANAKELMERLHARSVANLMFISTKCIPCGCFDKWFGITSLDIG